MRSLILCPTRGRPEAAREAHQSFIDTITRDDSDIMFVVDDDDPLRGEYEKLVPTLVLPAPGNMVNALNGAASWALQKTKAQYLGFIGDDHRFRTKGWDEIFVSLLDKRGGGMVYANDGFRVDIPTQILMSSKIVAALGWMGLPTCTHLYIDNAWRVIGDSIERLYYMPDVMIEHLHPAAGKAEWDEGHKRVNTGAMYQHDSEAFADWINSGGVARDVEKVRAAVA